MIDLKFITMICAVARATFRGATIGLDCGIVTVTSEKATIGFNGRRPRLAMKYLGYSVQP